MWRVLFKTREHVWRAASRTVSFDHGEEKRKLPDVPSGFPCAEPPCSKNWSGSTRPNGALKSPLIWEMGRFDRCMMAMGDISGALGLGVVGQWMTDCRV